MSPDPLIQNPYDLQSYNRYSYCLNNPLKYTDPSGYFPVYEDLQDSPWCTNVSSSGTSGTKASSQNGGVLNVLRWYINGKLGGFFDKSSKEESAQAQSENERLAQSAADRAVEAACMCYEIEAEGAMVALSFTPPGAIMQATYTLGTGKDLLGNESSRLGAAVSLVPGFGCSNLKILNKVKGRIGLLDDVAALGNSKQALAAETVTTKLYHYTESGNVASILEKGLTPGRTGQVFTTSNGSLTPIQAQIELALSPNRGLPGALLEIDAVALQRAGIKPVFGPTRVLPTSNAPGGGVEIIFDEQIPAEFIKRVK